ncbi:hypothetical protein K402DRAFT_320367, partial [Aulographum hederae CBS 113979]
MTYGSQLWAIDADGERINQSVIQCLEIVQNTCLRRIIGAYTRTPVAAIQREVAVPPLDLFLQLQATQRAEDSA